MKNNALVLADWKTSVGRKTNDEDRLPEGHSYLHQCGAYSLSLKYMTGLEIAGAAVVLARRCGPPNVHIMDRDELALAEDAFVARSIQYFENLEIPIQA